MSANDSEAWFGARIRKLRRERGFTLKALGQRAALSHPFLSQLERGLARPSVRSVERIARALDVPVGALWAPPRKDAARLARAGDAVVGPHRDDQAPGGVRELFGPDAALRVREWSGGSREWPAEAETTAGEVVVYVVRGAIEVDLDGTVHALAAGDALSFDGTVRHRLRRRGAVTTRALYVASG